MQLKFDTGAALSVVALGVALAVTLVVPAYAQMATAGANATNAETGSPTRGPMKMDAKEFLRTHQWNENDDTWSMRSGMEPPMGVMSRAEVKAQRDAFLSNNRWDNITSQYVPIKTGPRTMSSLTRAEVKAETMQFMRTHEWDEENSVWKAIQPVRKNKM